MDNANILFLIPMNMVFINYNNFLSFRFNTWWNKASSLKRNEMVQNFVYSMLEM
jgi:hypothetical protein